MVACFLCFMHYLQYDLDDPERGMIFVCGATHKTKVMLLAIIPNVIMQDES